MKSGGRSNVCTFQLSLQILPLSYPNTLAESIITIVFIMHSRLGFEKVAAEERATRRNSTRP